MSAAPLIGVVVPVHNAAAFLPACLAALRAQTQPDFVCALVDDGSTDASPALCDAAARQDPRFTALHQRQSGVCAARVAGVQAVLAKGVQWLAFCDADDVYHPAFLQTLWQAAHTTDLPLACCRYETFTESPAADQAPPAAPKVLAHPKHLHALLHDHAVDFGLWNKLYAADLLTPAMLDNGLAYNEDLLANWQAFCAAPGCALCDFAGYHYRQHAQSASHRPLSAQSIDDQRHAALYIREHAAPEIQRSADAFYYEKLVYLASMILRRDNPMDYRAQLGELTVGISGGLKLPSLGRNPDLPFAVRVAAWFTVRAPRLWQRICRRVLKDRQ